MNINNATQKDNEKTAVSCFEKESGLTDVSFDVLERHDGPYLIIFLACPTERYFKYLNLALEKLPDDNVFKSRATLKKRSGISDRLDLPEVKRLRRLVSESLTATKNSVLNGDFSERYIDTVDRAEQQIISKSNHVVYGRRGAGKSSLMLYSVNLLEAEGLVYSWLAMQTFASMHGLQLKASVVSGMLAEMSNCSDYQDEVEELVGEADDISYSSDEKGILVKFNGLIRKTRALLSRISRGQDGLFIFLDDFHVIAKDMQSDVLSVLYSIARDNGVYIKFSAVESFSNLFDSKRGVGLEVPHDVQVINLDRNLTMPHRSFDHINKILDSYSYYCGLPNVTYICGSGVLERLVWVAAGVPRDALNLFSDAISKSIVKGQKKVSVTSVNLAASEMADSKIKDIEKDVSDGLGQLRVELDLIKNFCVSDRKKNAFLVEIKPETPKFKLIESLVSLRFLHVLNEGVTPFEAGRRYKALMLDYGFYVGIRAARSVDLFQTIPDVLTARELRGLPIYEI